MGHELAMEVAHVLSGLEVIVNADCVMDCVYTIDGLQRSTILMCFQHARLCLSEGVADR